MTDEVKDGQQAAEGAEQAGKKKKMNRYSLDEVNKKIAAMEEQKLTLSKYYKHLLQRKKEMEAKPQ